MRTPVSPKTRESCLEKAGSNRTGSDCGPSYASADISEPLGPWLQPCLALVLSPAPYPGGMTQEESGLTSMHTDLSPGGGP